MILLIDNYDSFSYNLYQLIGTFRTDIKVIRNDELTVEAALALNPDHIILSPGPGKPIDAGICEEIALKTKNQAALLGVCLGHQAICEAFGGKIIHSTHLMHGKQSDIKRVGECKLFNGMDNIFKAARYHSLAVSEENLPECLTVTAVSDNREIMAVQHNDYNMYGVQFHPESILTPDGNKIIENFLNI